MGPVEEMWIEQEKIYMTSHEIVNQPAINIAKSSLDVTNTLLCLYVLTGCDSGRYPFKRGKNKATKVALGFVKTSPNLGFSDYVTDYLVSEGRKIFCTLYGKPGFS